MNARERISRDVNARGRKNTKIDELTTTRTRRRSKESKIKTSKTRRF